MKIIHVFCKGKRKDDPHYAIVDITHPWVPRWINDKPNRGNHWLDVDFNVVNPHIVYSIMRCDFITDYSRWMTSEMSKYRTKDYAILCLPEEEDEAKKVAEQVFLVGLKQLKDE